VPAVPRRRHRRLDQRASRGPVWHLDTRQQPPRTRNRNTSARPHRPPYDSTPILIDRVRRKRQRLRSNGSIESDSAVHHPLSADTPARRVTPDRVITFSRSQPPCHVQLNDVEDDPALHDRRRASDGGRARAAGAPLRLAGAWRVGATSDPRQRRAGARHSPSRRTPVSPRECWRGLA
jgi:hypothetical protein